MATITALIFLFAVIFAPALSATPSGTTTAAPKKCSVCCPEPLRNVGACANVPQIFDAEVVKKCGGGDNFSPLMIPAATLKNLKAAALASEASQPKDEGKKTAGSKKSPAADKKGNKKTDKKTEKKSEKKTDKKAPANKKAPADKKAAPAKKSGSVNDKTNALKNAGKPNKKSGKIVASKKKDEPKSRGKRDAEPDDPCVWDCIFKELDFYEDENEFDEEMIFNTTAEFIAIQWVDPFLHATLDCAELNQADMLLVNTTPLGCDYRAFFFMNCFHRTLTLLSLDTKDTPECKEKLRAVYECDPDLLADPEPAPWENTNLTAEEAAKLEQDMKSSTVSSSNKEQAAAGDGKKDGGKGDGKGKGKGKGGKGSGKGKDTGTGKGKGTGTGKGTGKGKDKGKAKSDAKKDGGKSKKGKDDKKKNG